MGWTDEDELQEDETTDDQEESKTESENDESMSQSQSVDLSSLAPSAMDVDEAAEKEHTWKIMFWGDEGVGKSHACYTMPEPVCFIDTENKADDIAHKFQEKEVHIWQPNDFDEAVEYRDEALSFLSEYESQVGEKGTLVVDSMAVMWDWAKAKYIDKYYNNTDPEDVTLSLEDWAPIKKIHNDRFRKPMESCDYHVAWTATRKDDVQASIENELDSTPDKPGGETDNKYKVNSIIRLKLNKNGIPVGILQKSGVLRFKYYGLTRPTFEKHKEIVNHIEEIESNGAETVEEVEQQYSLDYTVGFTEANTMEVYE